MASLLVVILFTTSGLGHTVAQQQPVHLRGPATGRYRTLLGFDSWATAPACSAPPAAGAKADSMGESLSVPQKSCYNIMMQLLDRLVGSRLVEAGLVHFCFWWLQAGCGAGRRVRAVLSRMSNSRPCKQANNLPSSSSIRHPVA